MSYIDVTHPRDWGLYTLVCYPFEEGMRNLWRSFEQDGNSPSPLSLIDRVSYFGVGLLLLLPIVNTIVFIALRCFSVQPPIFFDHHELIPYPPEANRSNEEKERVAKINLLSAKRSETMVKLKSLSEDNCERALLQKELREIELEAAKTMVLQTDECVKRHISLSHEKNISLTKWDGIITALGSESKINLRENEVLPADFIQASGLTQQEGDNHMCGYYALFFMLQAVKGKEFTDRDAFNVFLDEVVDYLLIKRSASQLNSLPIKGEIPYGLKLPMRGISCWDMQEIVENVEGLAPLKETAGCFVLEMDDFYATPDQNPWPEPIVTLGKDRIEKKQAEDFPIYFIVKNSDIHYYLFYAKEPGKFTAVHSLNYSIFNPNYFKPETFTDIVKALTGTKTPLELSW